ncbi:helix-turn-helix transcriptional regulator [Aeromonas caviae]
MSVENIRLLRIRDVTARVCMSKPTIYLKIKAGDFPKPVTIGPKAVAWVESEVNAWLLQRMNER